MPRAMSPNLKPATFRIDEHLLEGLEFVRQRDGIGVSEQVRRAIVIWLETKGISDKKTERRRAVTRKRS